MTGAPASAGDLLPPERIVEIALAACPADACAVLVRSVSAAHLRWANNGVTTSGIAASLGFHVVAMTGGAAVTVAGSAADATSPAGVAAVARAAAEAARAASPSPDAMPLPGGPVDPDFPDGAAATSFAVFEAVLGDLADAFAAARQAGRVLYGFARHDVATLHLGTSTGVRRRWVQPDGTLELTAKAADPDRSAWAGISTTDFADVRLRSLDAELTRRLGWARRTVALPPGRYDTVLPPTSVADFMVDLAWNAAALPAHEGRSAFAGSAGTRVGERLTTRPLTLFTDPAATGLRCAPFVATTRSADDVSVFDNGAPVGRLDLVHDGVIAGLVHTRATAARYAAPFTPAADNLTLVGGDPTRTTADLVAGVDRGLVVTSLWYIREVDPAALLLTGLTRDGVFLVEHGEITAAVNNFRFNVSPFDVLRNAADVGGTRRCLSREWGDWITRTAMPPIRVTGFHMSSVSPAQ